uniref:(northern house mosquito) hypothetical protein n=1 Tax=Culex pipiens TaxID=7175 RepID=A0A8D8BF14_CULPI
MKRVQMKQCFITQKLLTSRKFNCSKKNIFKCHFKFFINMKEYLLGQQIFKIRILIIFLKIKSLKSSKNSFVFNLHLLIIFVGQSRFSGIQYCSILNIPNHTVYNPQKQQEEPLKVEKGLFNFVIRVQPSDKNRNLPVNMASPTINASKNDALFSVFCS